MGPTKDLKRKTRRELKKNNNNKKKVDYQNCLTALWSHEPHVVVDWLDAFSNAITGSVPESRDLKKFESLFKMTRKTFDYICSLVKDDLSSRQSNFCTDGRILSPVDQIAIALRRLSSGESLANVGEFFGINLSAVSQITWRFVEAMEVRGLHHLQWPSLEAEISEIKSDFEKVHGLPNCCGMIGTAHILMTLPAVDGSHTVWIDREKNHSMILQAIVDSKGRFLDVVVGYPGSLSNAQVLQNSAFFRLCEGGKRLNGKKQVQHGVELGEYIIGDSGFPLLPWLFPPYQKELLNHQSVFNKRHHSTQAVARNALARLKEMWRIINGVMWLPDKNRLPRIVFTCCLLHNILIDMDDAVLREMQSASDHDSSYCQQVCGFSSDVGADMRDQVALCLSGKLQP